jgi:hypothetical protein
MKRNEVISLLLSKVVRAWTESFSASLEKVMAYESLISRCRKQKFVRSSFPCVTSTWNG